MRRLTHFWHICISHDRHILSIRQSAAATLAHTQSCIDIDDDIVIPFKFLEVLYLFFVKLARAALSRATRAADTASLRLQQKTQQTSE